MPKTKEAIIERLHTERRRLEQKLAGLSPEEMTQPGVVGDWSVKDVLAHLADWEQMCLGWCAACDRGEKPETPAPGHYSFTGRRALADWMGHYAHHDEWGKDEIRKWRKMRAG